MVLCIVTAQGLLTKRSLQKQYEDLSTLYMHKLRTRTEDSIADIQGGGTKI